MPKLCIQFQCTYLHLVLQYLLLSMVTYGLFEVSAKKWLVPVGDTAPMTNSLRGLGMMGVHTLLWMWYVCMYLWHTIESH